MSKKTGNVNATLNVYFAPDSPDSYSGSGLQLFFSTCNL